MKLSLILLGALSAACVGAKKACVANKQICDEVVSKKECTKEQKKACPICKKCVMCEDSATWARKETTCAKIAEMTKKKAKKQCKKKGKKDKTKGKKSCPVACGKTLPETCESADAAATGAPTDMPTDMPTDTPTDMPTDTPTDMPTKPPTNMPTDMPTKMPTNLPTRKPTPAPTDAPDLVINWWASTLDHFAAEDVSYGPGSASPGVATIQLEWASVHDVWRFESAAKMAACDFSGGEELVASTTDGRYLVVGEPAHNPLYLGCSVSDHCTELDQKIALTYVKASPPTPRPVMMLDDDVDDCPSCHFKPSPRPVGVPVGGGEAEDEAY